MLIFLVFVFGSNIVCTHGFAHIAISTHLPENKQIVETGWSRILSWVSTPGYGHILSSSVVKNGQFEISQSGLYNVFTTVTFLGAQNGVFKLAVIINNDLVNKHPGLISSFDDAIGYQSLSVFGTVRLNVGDLLSVYVYSEEDVDFILAGKSESTFCVELAGFYNQIPGFSSYITKAQVVSKTDWQRILRWKSSGLPGLFNSRLGFSDNVGELVPICDGVYQISANVRILSFEGGEFEIGISHNGNLDGSFTKTKVGSDVTDTEISLVLSLAMKLKKGDRITVHGRGSKKYAIQLESGFFGMLVNRGDGVPGLSTVFSSSVKRRGTEWVNIPIPKPKQDSGQFQSHGDSLSNGRYYYSETRIFTISATILVKSPMSTTLVISLQNDDSSFAALKTGLYSTNQRSSTTSSYSLSGILELGAGQPLSMFIYLTSEEEYEILPGSRVCVTSVQQDYEAFNAVLTSPVSMSNDNEWKKIDKFHIGSADSFLFMDRFVSGKYTAIQTGVYFFSANIIFKDADGPISVIISVNGDTSKRTSLYATKGSPALVEDSLSVAGPLLITEGFSVSVYVMIEDDKSWSIGIDSSFSMVFVGYQFAVPGVSTVLQNGITFETAGWFKIDKWRDQSVTGPMFNSGGEFRANAGEFIAPITGIYLVSASVKMMGANAQNSMFTLNAALNGNPSTFQYQNGLQDYIRNDIEAPIQQYNDMYSLVVCGVLEVQAGDSIALYIRSEIDTSYKISQDSSFSVIYIAPLEGIYSSAMQMMLDISINQEQLNKGATWRRVRNWEKRRTNTAPGVFSRGSLLVLDSNSGTIQVLESGIYFISVNLAIDLVVKKNFQLGVHTSRNGVTSLITKYGESSRSQFTMKVFGTIYLTRNQEISVKVQPTSSGATWENLRPYSGWSIVRIPFYSAVPTLSLGMDNGNTIPAMGQLYWAQLQAWSSALSTTEGIDGLGFNYEKGVYVVPHEGVYLVSASITIFTNESEVSLKMKIGVDGALGGNVFESGSGASHLLPLCVEKCVVSVTQTVKLERGQKVAIYLNSRAQKTYLVQSTRFSCKLIAVTTPTRSGFSLQLSNALNMFTAGMKTITSWSVVHPTMHYYKVSPDLNEYVVTRSGVYLAAFNIDVIDVKGMMSVAMYLDNGLVNSYEYFAEANVFTISSSAVLSINPGMSYKLKINTNTDASYSLGQSSTSSLTYIGDNLKGFSASKVQPHVDSYESAVWYPIKNWITVGNSWLFNNGNGLLNNKDFVVPEPGFYFVAANIVIAQVVTSAAIELRLTRNKLNIVELFDKKFLSTRGSVTLQIQSGMNFDKFDFLQLEVSVASGISSMMIKRDSTFSIIRLGADRSLTTCLNGGPRMLGELDNGNPRLGRGENIEWSCMAVGGNPVYQWMKNFEPLTGETGTTLQLVSTKVTDTGKYVCTASSNDIVVSSNMAEIVVFDAFPAFLNNPSDFRISTPENGPQTLKLLDISAKTQSFESNDDEMMFEIVRGNDEDIFSISPVRSITGTTLSRTKRLDREEQANFTLRIAARNRLKLEFETFQEVEISVTDENDNPPVFAKSHYEANVSENAIGGKKIIEITAEDADISVNAHIKYSLVPISESEVFAIDQSTGWISLAGSLDREKKDSYVVVVQASNDLSPSVESAYVDVKVFVDDVNEFAPTWLQDKYNIDVSESLSLHMPIIQLLATDKDMGRNSLLSFTISSGNTNEKFLLTDGGVLQLTSYLDYKDQSKYELQVSLSDNGSPRLSTQTKASIVVNVQDSNNNNPLFEKPEYIANIAENSGLFVPSLFVKAMDRDKGGIMRYSIPSYHNLSEVFDIGLLSGEITLKKKLDYEQLTFIQFTVVATDSGAPPQMTRTNVLVNINDENDNPPIFTKLKDSITVSEGGNVGRVIYRVQATDQDSGGNGEFKYKIDSGNDEGFFYINSHTGDVTAQKPLNRERLNFFSLRISAVDSGSPPKSSEEDFALEISITDLNDNSPQFDQPSYSIDVNEDVSVGEVLTQFTVRDADASNKFNVTILDREMRHLFSVQAKSAIEYNLVLSSPLDFEVKNIYKFTMIAKDDGSPSLSSSTPVTVYVYEVNDNAPSFGKSTYSTTLSDTTIANLTVFQLLAADLDVGPGGRLSYSIIAGNTDNAFFIERYTGIVRSQPREGFTFASQYRLIIIAQDSYTPPKSSPEVSLFVRVTVIPNIQLRGVQIGQSQFEANVSLRELAHLTRATKLQVLVQRYQPEDENFISASLDDPITWYKSTTTTNRAKLQRYVAIEKSLPLRRRRSVIDVDDSLFVVIGNEKDCKEMTSVCNGPLSPGIQYRLQLRVFEQGSLIPVDSHFSRPVAIPSLGQYLSPVTEMSQDGMLALAAAFASICLLSFAVILIYVCWKQRHEILYKEHLSDNNFRKTFQDDEKYSPPDPNTFYTPTKGDRLHKNVWSEISEEPSQREESEGGSETDDEDDNEEDSDFDEEDNDLTERSDGRLETSEFSDLTVPTESDLINKSSASHNKTRAEIAEREPTDNLYALAYEMSKREGSVDQWRPSSVSGKQSSMSDVVLLAQAKEVERKKLESSIEYESISSQVSYPDDDQSILL